jgi:hypothetical protein
MFDADWEAYGLTYLVLKELMPLKHMRELDEELLACRDVLKGYDGKSFHFSSNLETDDFYFFWEQIFAYSYPLLGADAVCGEKWQLVTAIHDTRR